MLNPCAYLPRTSLTTVSLSEARELTKTMLFTMVKKLSSRGRKQGDTGAQAPQRKTPLLELEASHGNIHVWKAHAWLSVWAVKTRSRKRGRIRRRRRRRRGTSARRNNIIRRTPTTTMPTTYTHHAHRSRVSVPAQDIHSAVQK